MMTEQAKAIEPDLMRDRTPLSDAQKWMIAGVCLVAALAMRYAGLLTLWPRDPGLPISLLTCRHPGLATMEMLAVAAVASALVTAAVGRRLPGVGVLAVGAGLLATGWSDADWRPSMAYVQQLSQGWTATHIRLIGETLGWAGAILAALAAGSLTLQWLGPRPPGQTATAAMYSRTSIFVRTVARSHEQWLMWLAAGLAGVVLIEVLYARSIAANLGQGYFIAGVAMAAGVCLGHQVFPVKSLWPAALAWLVPAIAGRVWAILSSDRVATWMQAGINPLADMLPIQYAAGGTMGGIIGLWLSYQVMAWRQEQAGN